MQLESELSYFEVTIQYLSHNAMGLLTERILGRPESEMERGKGRVT